MTEREWIDQYFLALNRTSGRFLDIGAFDGQTDSLTAGLADAGWTGVCCEPDPATFLKLAQRYRGRAGIDLVNAAVAATAGLRQFHRAASDPQVSTLAVSHAAGFPDADYQPAYYVSAVGLRALLKRFGGPRHWHCVAIDAEGVSHEILADLPLHAMAETEVICCEIPEGRAEHVRSLLEPLYRIEMVTKYNVLGVRADLLHRSPFMSNRNDKCL